jgi:FkbM family methyltransferase
MGIARRVVGQVLNMVDRGDRVRAIRDFYFRDSWLRNISSIVHVGANTGQEAARYADRDLRVLWIEPIPLAFRELQKNIASYPKQSACQALVSDKEKSPITLNIASNGGQSSSIFELAGHREIWPEIDYTGRIEVLSRTLDGIISESDGHFDGLVMDTQGAELLIVKGAKCSLPQFKFIKTEAANFEMYKGAALEQDLIEFLKPYFKLSRRDVFASKPDGKGEVSDLLFERR